MFFRAVNRFLTNKFSFVVTHAFLAISIASIFTVAPASAAVVIDYTYDELDRLTDVTRSDGPVVTYDYDEVSNVATKAITNSPDTDGDNIADFADLDDDGDQMPDAWELLYGLDPLNPADASSDLDGDGDTALKEFLNGTDPTNPSDGSGAAVQIPMPGWSLAILAILLTTIAVFMNRTRSYVLLPLLVVSVMAIPVDKSYAQEGNLVSPTAVLQQPVESTDPGWYHVEATPVSPQDAHRILGEPLPADSLSITTSGLTAVTNAAFATPTDFTQLATALENDPLRIYHYVLNNFEYVPYYGALKGAYLTLHERSGNDFDQASLLIELLRAAGYTANYRYGLANVSTIDPEQLKNLADWLGTDENASIIAGTFANGGVPVTLYGDHIEFDHVWVEVTINSTIVSLDPSFKRSTKSSTIDLDTAMGFDQASLLAAAGGTLGTDSIENLSESGLNGYLSTLTTQLSNYLKANQPNSSVEDVIGGYTIIPDNSTALPASLPLPATPTYTAWDSIPTTYIHTVRLQHGGIDTTFDIPDIAGRKLSISYAGDTAVIPPPPAGATDFGSVAIDVDGPTYTWNPNNPNTVVIQVTSTITGPDASAFSFVTGGGTQDIPANGGSVDVSVKFSGVGQTAGRKNAVLTFDYSYLGSSIGSQTVDLTGVVEADRVAEIYLDDVLVVSEGTSSGNLNDLVVSVDHPYAANGGTLFDQTATFHLNRSGSYVLVSAFGGDKHSTLLGERQRLLNRMSIEGKAPDSREMVSETLNVIGQTWMQQTQLNADMVAAISGVRQIDHHRFGIAGQESGYFVDIKAQYVATPDRIASAKEGGFQVNSFIASAMEHSVLEQLQGVANPGISTIKIFTLNNQNAGKLFLVNSNNFATVQGQLVNYAAANLTNFQNLVNAGHTLILPQNGAVTLNSWSGKGYVDYNVAGSTRTLGMIIDGGLNGGFASQPAQVDPTPTLSQGDIQSTPPANIPTPTAGDPVDLYSGAFSTHITDISLVGQGTRGLAFTRSYNGQQVSDDLAGLGRGWNHSYNITLTENSNVAIGLGDRTPRDAAPLIVAASTMRHLMEPSAPSLQNWAVGALIANWATGQLLNKTVTVRMGDRALSYQELPDGSFVPPPGITTDMVQLPDNTYELHERLGTVLKFNSSNKIESIVDIDGNALTFTYTGDKLTQVKDAYNRTLTLSYSGNALTSVSDQFSRIVTFTQTAGNLTDVSGLESAKWTYSYDTLHRLLTVVDPETVTIVDNTYDNFDRVTQQRAPRDTGIETYHLHYSGMTSAEEDPLGNRLTYYYDYTGRTIAVEDALGNIARTGYDGQGQVTKLQDARGNETLFAYDGFNDRTQTTDPLLHDTGFTYDSQHRLTRVTDALGHFAETDYDATHHPVASRNGESNEATATYFANGLTHTQTNPRLVTTTTNYDSHGYPASSQTGSQPATNMVYNSIGRLSSLTDEAGTKTQFVYDDRGLVTQRTDAFNQNTLSGYDNLGRLISQTDRKGDTVTTSYTDSGKLDTLTFPGYSVGFNYDSRDNLVSMADPLGNTSNTYDAVNRITSHTDPNGFTVSYSYDEAGNVTQITYPGNKTVSYSYDALNRINGITIDWLSVSATPTYDAAGRLTGVAHFNGTSTSYSYDKADRLTGITHNKGAQIIADYQYTLDANGNRTKAIIENEPILPAALINKSEVHTYNSYKNRLTNATLGGSPVNFVYDNEGQLQSKGTITFTFDSAHRLTGYGSNSYQYDGVGNRLIATRSGVTTKYIYDAAGNLLAEANASNAIQRYYIHGIGLMAMVDAATNALYVYHFDGTGHTVAMTDSSQIIVNKYAYTPYGVLLAKDETVPQPFTYIGKFGVMTESDSLFYMRARYYDAEVGRFIKEDPIGFNGGLNLYAYVGGNPVNAIDPLGLKPPKDIPPGVSVRKNIKEAQNMSYKEWYNAVKNSGKWDYKQQGSQYEAFGNYNYGVTARAVGIPGNIPNRGAGWAQGQAGTSDPKWGNWWDWPGSTSFGDDPADQRWINEGIKDYENGYWNSPSKP